MRVTFRSTLHADLTNQLRRTIYRMKRRRKCLDASP